MSGKGGRTKGGQTKGGGKKAGRAIETCPEKWKTLTVFVRSADGTALPEAVSLTLAGPGSPRTISGPPPLGMAVFRNLAPGQYALDLAAASKPRYTLVGGVQQVDFADADETVMLYVGRMVNLKIKVSRQDNGVFVPGATVRISRFADGTDLKQDITAVVDGLAQFQVLTPMKYKIEVLPQTIEGRIFTASKTYSLALALGQEKGGNIPIATAALEMHLDADRDGTVDAAPSNHAAWTWGAQGPGAVVLVRTVHPQANGTEIGERCPLDLRWTGAYLDGWTASLSVDAPAKLRVYDANGPIAGNQEGATLVIGTAYDLSWRLPDPNDAQVLTRATDRIALANLNGTYATELEFETAARVALEAWTRADQQAKNGVASGKHLDAMEEPMTRLCGAPLTLNDVTRAALADELSNARHQWVLSLGDVAVPGWLQMRALLNGVITASLANTPATSPDSKAGGAWAIFPDKDRIKNAAVTRTPRVLDHYDLTTAVPAGASLAAAGRSATLWIEAADYPATGADADWEATLTLNFTSAGSAAQPARTAVVRIAPWLMSSDMDPTEVVYVKAVKPLNYAGLQAAVEADSIAATDMAREIQAFAQGANATLRATVVANAAAKGFMRDVIKCGYQMSPRAFWRVVLTGLDSMGSLGAVSDRLKESATVGLLQRALGPEPTSQDNGGNYTLSPPTPAYPWGRILLGHRPAEQKQCNLYEFYRNQRYQKPLIIDTTWLAVGHTDEILSVLPHAGGHKVLIASGRLAYAIICRAAMPAVSAAAVLADAEQFNTAQRANVVTVAQMQAQFGNNGGAQTQVLVPMPLYEADPPALAGEQMVIPFRNQDRSMGKKQISFSKYIADQTAFINAFLAAEQVRLDATRLQLTNDLGIQPADIIEIPVTWDDEMRGKIPETADSVNLLMLVSALGHATCLIPKPFGPVFGTEFLFETYMRDKLGALATVAFLNDWVDFHTDDGEIHCGTNQLPAPLPPNRRTWWLNAPPAM